MKHSRENRSAENNSGATSGSKSEAAADGSFIGRWSRRKREAGVDVPAPLTEEPAPEPAHTIHSPETSYAAFKDSAESEAEAAAPLTDADMPDIDTLHADSDFSPFFSEGVSKELRNLALKKLFFSGKFSARDGLDDYDDDFTKFEPLGDTVTSDMKFHARRKEKARLAALEEEERLRLQTPEPTTDDETLAVEASDEPAAPETEAETAEVASVDLSEHSEEQSDTMESSVNASDAESAADEKQQNV